jgi:Arc/MetJ-type ribon-helix-helix transcriptional regulator
METRGSTVPADKKMMSLRLDPQEASDAETVATVDGVSVSEVVREALRRYVNDRQADPDFQRELRSSLERNRRALQRLASRSAS